MKHSSKILSVLMALMMVFSVITTPVQAKDGDTLSGWSWLGSRWNQESEEPEQEAVPEEIPTEETPAEEPEQADAAAPEETPVVVEYPAVNFENYKVEGTDIVVSVEAPEGAFPEGTEMLAAAVTDQSILDAAVEAVEGEARAVVAVDISFRYNDQEIEPATEIKVTLAKEELAESNDFSVVHVDDEGVATKLDDEKVENNGEEVAFTNDEFSVYVIIDGAEPGEETPYRTTYEFYNADGTDYYFVDAANNLQHTQILKNGESLEDVGLPTKGASQNAKFIGWFDEDGNEVKIGEPLSVTENGTVKLTAKYQAIVNVFFVTAVDEEGNRSIVTVKQVQYTTGDTTPVTVDTNDVKTSAPSAEQAVIGWNTDETAANEGIVASEDGIVDLSDRTTDDVMMFPAIANAYWLYFDKNDGGTGGNTSYTAPQFVTVGGKTVKPEDPHRAGYSFGGWYEDSACTTPYTFGQTLTATKTVYAKWNPDQANYTVVVWVQRTSDSANVTSSSNLDDDQKTYDFYRAYPLTAGTGTSVSVANTYKNLGNTIDSNGHIKFNRCDDAKTVEADGSTVLNVYYDRDVFTLTFLNRQGGSATDTWYGLYDATFAESNYTWKSETHWRSRTTLYTFLDSFKDYEDNEGTSTTLYPYSSSGSWYDIYFYKESLTGTWELANQSEFDAEYFNFTEKYNGFSLSQYSRDGRTYRNIPSSRRVNRDYQDLYIRFTRNSYDLEFHNGVKGAQGTIVRTDSVKYEASLYKHATPTVTYPVDSEKDHYQFLGWFADTSFTTYVSFDPAELTEQFMNEYREYYGVSTFTTYDKMPAHNIPLYAGWGLVGYDCALNPNGGQLKTEAPPQAGVFWVEYGKTISDSIITSTTREGYNLVGWMVSNVDGDLIGVYRDPTLGVRFVGDFSNWSATEEPWNFDKQIEGPVYLTAIWDSKTAIKVVYDANGGTEAPVDNGEYRDRASTVAFGAPIAPEGKNFIGWDIVGTEEEEKLQPGDPFTINNEYAVDGTITLIAVYHSFNPEEEVPVTHITWYSNVKDTNGTAMDLNNFVKTTDLKDDAKGWYVTDDELQTNASVDIRPSTTYSYTGHKFLGWAKSADATAENLFIKWDAENNQYLGENGAGEWVPVTQVAADENKPYDDLYAIWEQQYFYVYHSGVKDGNVETIAITPGTYDLTDTPAKLTAGTLYGGYYLENNFTAPEDKAAYDGDNWTWTKAETVNGKAITPVAETTYYLKEVPANKFLQPYMHYTYYKANNNISNLWMISDIDDLMYKETGFIVTSNNVAKVCKSLTVKNKVGGARVKLTPVKVFGTKGATANDYLTYLDMTSQFKGQEVDVKMYWVTMDGLVVTGTVQRSVNGKTFTKTGIQKEDKAVASTITVKGE